MVAVTVVESAIAGKRLALIQTPKDLRPRPLVYKGITRRGPEILQKMGSRCAPETTLKGSHSDWEHQHHPNNHQLPSCLFLTGLLNVSNWNVGSGARLALTAGDLPQTFINASWFDWEPLTLVHRAFCQSTKFPCGVKTQ